MIVFGGEESGVSFPDAATYFNDVWELPLSGGTWTQLTPGNEGPGGRAFHAAVYDVPRDRMLILGGAYMGPYSCGFGACNGYGWYLDVWALSLEDLQWTRLKGGDFGDFNAVIRQSAIFDPVDDRVLLHGGVFLESMCTNCGHPVLLRPTRHPELDAFLGSRRIYPSWEILVPDSLPVPRYLHSAVHDRVRDRMLVFGGKDPDQDELNDVMSFDLRGAPHWESLSPQGGPPPVHDIPRGRV